MSGTDLASAATRGQKAQRSLSRSAGANPLSERGPSKTLPHAFHEHFVPGKRCKGIDLAERRDQRRSPYSLYEA
eukprot:2596066-Rhodomonas_salina.3